MKIQTIRMVGVDFIVNQNRIEKWFMKKALVLIDGFFNFIICKILVPFVV
jgi:hypothetical protein